MYDWYIYEYILGNTTTRYKKFNLCNVKIILIFQIFSYKIAKILQIFEALISNKLPARVFK